MNDIIKFEGRSLEELLHPCNEAQKTYLSLRTRGIDVHDAMRFSNRQPQTGRVWRLDDPYFKELEEYLIEHRDIYISQAEKAFTSRLVLLDEGLMRLAEKITEWDTQKESDKKWIIKACEVLKKLHISRGSGSYDEMILKRRRE